MIRYARKNLRIGEDVTMDSIQQWFAINKPKFEVGTVMNHVYMNSVGSEVRNSHPKGRAVDIFRLKEPGVFTRIIPD